MKKWILLILGLLGIDQLTKFLVVQGIGTVGDTVPVIQNFFHLTYVRNSNAVFGLPISASYIFYVVMAVIATAIFVYMLYKNNDGDQRKVWFRLSLTLMIAGALGNGIDRVFQFDHSVIDFIDFRGIWQYVFNFADMCLVVGIILFAFDQFILEPKRNEKKDEAK